MKNWWTVALGVIFGLLSAAMILLANQPPRGNPISLLPPPTPFPIQVHVSGEVANPGVYALPPESRVEQAIQAAGGFTSSANPSDLNLAAVLEDGQRIQVSAQTPTAVPIPTTPAKPQDPENPSETTDPAVPSSSQQININTATQEELETLSGIGPVTFEKIKDFITVDQ